MPGEDTAHLVALTTVGSLDEARSLVRDLIDLKLIACGNILSGATSIYRWEGKVAEESEAVVLMKTRRERWSELAEAIRVLHPYKLPELLAIPVEEGLPAYLAWVTSETITSK